MDWCANSFSTLKSMSIKHIYVICIFILYMYMQNWFKLYQIMQPYTQRQFDTHVYGITCTCR